MCSLLGGLCAAWASAAGRHLCGTRKQSAADGRAFPPPPRQNIRWCSRVPKKQKHKKAEGQSDDRQKDSLKEGRRETIFHRTLRTCFARTISTLCVCFREDGNVPSPHRVGFPKRKPGVHGIDLKELARKIRHTVREA